MKQSLFLLALVWYQHTSAQRVVAVTKTTQVQFVQDSLLVITDDMAIRDMVKKAIPQSRIRETEYNGYSDTWKSWLSIPKEYAKFALELIRQPLKLSI